MNLLLLLIAWPVLLLVCLPVAAALSRTAARADADTQHLARRLWLRRLARRRGDRREDDRRSGVRPVARERRQGERRMTQRRASDPALGTAPPASDLPVSARGVVTEARRVASG
jgi:hypothetical protein